VGRRPYTLSPVGRVSHRSRGSQPGGRPGALLDQQEEYVQGKPSLQWVFDFLEQHWPYLVNAVECQLTPATNNNVVEMVIRRFDVPKLVHYQNFCSFESIETAPRSTASRPSPAMPGQRFGVEARCNWPGMT